MSQFKKQKSGGGFGLLLLFFSAGLVVAAFLWPHSPVVSPVSNSGQLGSAEQNSVLPGSARGPLPRAVVNRINEELKETAIKEEMQRQNRALEVESAPPIGVIDEDAVRSDQLKNSTNPLVLEQENAAAKALQDSRAPRAPLTSDQRINSQLAKEQWTQEYDKKYQEEYVRQFIQNARKSGVDVKVNKDLDVTGVAPYPVDEPLRFPQSERPSSSDSAK